MPCRNSIEPHGPFLGKTVDGMATLESWQCGSEPTPTSGSFTDPRDPDASAEMLRFFPAHPQA